MRLSAIAAQNYRTLQDIRIAFSKGYCTISGRNNAGKSCVIQLLSKLFSTRKPVPWMFNDSEFDYDTDKTQWVKEKQPISVEYQIELTQQDDPALITYIKKIASIKVAAAPANVQLSVTYTVSPDDKSIVTMLFNGKNVDDAAVKEILRKIKDSNLMFLYNSASASEGYYFSRGRGKMFYDFTMSADEKKALTSAQNELQKAMGRLAKGHTRSLATILGRLSEKYDVQASPPEGYALSDMPLGINLKDKNVDIPLGDWGSGTQNRTHILMSILQANRIKTASADDRITPVVIIEEPESFLHPSAQAEFGGMLKSLSSEFGIQIIATTHSPYMLNQEDPAANVLLERRQQRRKLCETAAVEARDDNWMAPFADHLGIGVTEFRALRPIFSAGTTNVLLVEGKLDVIYFKLLQEGKLACVPLNKEIEIVPYGGKDSLKNTILIQFVIRRFDNVFITYDLDAHTELSVALKRLSLKQNDDYIPIGVAKPGRECIEGALPESVLSTVNGRETDLVMKLGSIEKKKAKDELKVKYLEEFEKRTDYAPSELTELDKIVRIINKRFSVTTVRKSTDGPQLENVRDRSEIDRKEEVGPLKEARPNST